MSKTVSKGRKTWKDGSVMTYTITDDGVLTISGSLSNGRIIPSKLKAPFHKLVIAEGVLSIGQENFYEWKELEELTLPSSLVSIGDDAFLSCTNIRHIRFSEGLQSIGKAAFMHDVSLEELLLPRTLVSVGKDAFYRCTKLSRVSLPASLREIGVMMFDDCTSLSRIKIPRGIKVIGTSAFSGCENLIEVSLPNGLQVIEDSAFRSCEALETISFPPSVERIGSSAFMGCDKLHDVYLPNDDIQLKTGSWGASFCREVSCTMTGEDGNEYECKISNVNTNRNDVWLKPSGKITGDVIVPSQVEYNGRSFPVTIIEREAFYGMDIRSVVLPDSVVLIEDSAFKCCRRLRNVTLGNSLKKIGNSAFGWCDALTYMPMPASVEQVGYQALQDTRMVSVQLQRGVIYFGHILYGYNGYLPEHSYIVVREGTTVIADSAFNSKFEYRFDGRNLEGVVLPAGMKRIGDGAFAFCKGLLYINLPESIEYVSSYSFDKNVKIVPTPKINPKMTQTVEYCPNDANIIEETERYTLDDNGILTFKDDVTMLKDEEFKGRNDIKKVILPGTVDSVGESSFAGCKSLKEVVFSEGVRIIWRWAFRGCHKLKKIQLPSSMENVCSSAFSYCKGLKEAIVPSNTWIEDHVFDGCDALKKVIIRDVKPVTTSK